MSDFLLVIKQAAVWAVEFIKSFSSHWFTQLMLFNIVLSYIVGLIQIWRGGRGD